MIKKENYLNMIRNEEYTELYQYYTQDTYLDILGVARMENPHSNFISWLLNPAGSHGLGDFPLRRLIATLLLAKETLNKERFSAKINETDEKLVNLCNAEEENQGFLDVLMYGNYILSEVNVFREFCIGEQGKKKSRADIFVSFKATFGKQTRQCIVLIENKIKSEEHDSQTETYYKELKNGASNILKEKCGFELSKKEDKVYAFFVYLTAGSSESIGKKRDYPKSDQFMRLNYQYLLDGVLEPCLQQEPKEQTKQRISEYIRCLGQDAKLGEDERGQGGFGKGNADDTYLIMAVSSREKNWALKLRENDNNKETIENIFELLAHEPNNPFGDKEKKFWRRLANLYSTILTEGSVFDKAQEMLKTNSKARKEFVFPANDAKNKIYGMRKQPNNFGRLCRDIIEWAVNGACGEKWDKARVEAFREILWEDKSITNWLLDIILFESEKDKLFKDNVPVIAVNDTRNLRKYHINDKADFKTHFFEDSIKIGDTAFYVAKYWGYSDYGELIKALDKMGCKNIPVEERNPN